MINSRRGDVVEDTDTLQKKEIKQISNWIKLEVRECEETLNNEEKTRVKKIKK